MEYLGFWLVARILMASKVQYGYPIDMDPIESCGSCQCIEIHLNKSLSTYCGRIETPSLAITFCNFLVSFKLAELGLIEIFHETEP